MPEAWVFETGANRWRRFERWPPPGLESRSLHLRAGGSLEFAASDRDEENAFEEFVSDPAKPVPYTMAISTGWHAEYMVEDQRFAAWRPDVLVFRSEPLEEDVTLAGPMMARLWVSTTGTAADWMVKLIDEFPGRLPDHDPDPDSDSDSEDEDLGGTQRLVRL